MYIIYTLATAVIEAHVYFCLLQLKEHRIFAELKEKSYFSYFRFLFSSFGHFCTKNCQLLMNFHDNSKNKNWKNQKIDFSFDSAHCASFMKTGEKLRKGSAYPYLGQGRSTELVANLVIFFSRDNQ